MELVLSVAAVVACATLYARERVRRHMPARDHEPRAVRLLGPAPERCLGCGDCYPHVVHGRAAPRTDGPIALPVAGPGVRQSR